MNKKQLSVEVKDADLGLVEAVFSTFNVVDHDGDVTLPGAFTDGQKVRISAYNHASWAGALPVGKGTIRVDADRAVLEGEFFLNTVAGRDTFEVVKGLGGLQEWSYGFDVLDSEPGTVDGRPVQMLKRVEVHEVSPVMLGAGIGTETLAVKSNDLLREIKFTEHIGLVIAGVKALNERIAEVIAYRVKNGKEPLSEDAVALLSDLDREAQLLGDVLTDGSPVEEPAVQEPDVRDDALREFLRFAASRAASPI
jgi:HK97 family phage prohead protease